MISSHAGPEGVILLLLVLLLALVNPLVCVLHCHLAPAAVSGNVHSHMGGFLCDLLEAHGTRGEGVPAPMLAPAPRAVYEATDTSSIPLLPLAPLAFLILITLLLPSTLGVPPLLPPPRPVM